MSWQDKEVTPCTRQSLWEILVPTQTNEGKPIRTRQHREWDSRVRRVSGGLTILPPAKGQWVAQDGELFKERMIPVRIVCTRQEIEKIIDMTMAFYEQLAVLAYKISDEVILKHADSKSIQHKSVPVVCQS